MMTYSELRAAQRIIEEDSYLMQAYLTLRDHMEFREAIEIVVDQIIKPSPAMNKRWNELKGETQ